MHIHGANMHPNPSLHSPHGSTSAMAARRAEETRKKLFAASAEIDPASDADSAWMVSMVGAWAGGNPSSGSDPSAQQNSQLSKSPVEVEEIPRTPASGPVSYWA